MIVRRSLPFVAILVSALVASADVPPRGDSLITLVPPKAHLDLGDIYYVYPGEDTQLAVTSDAQLQRTIAGCRRIAGYFVVPFDRKPEDAPIAGGALRIPVASLNAGATAYNDLLRGKPMFDMATHPEITFEITGVRDAKKTSGDKPPEEYTLTLTGKLSVKGKTLELTLPVRVALIPFTFRSMARYPGDLLTLRSSFELKLADLGLEKPGREWTDRMTDTFTFELFLCANVVPPDKSLDPATKQPANEKHLKYLMLLRDFDDPVKAYEFGRVFMNEIGGDAVALNRLAFDTVAEDDIRTRDLSFALQAAQKANAVSENKTAQFLDTLARVHFERGELADAVKFSQMAVERLEGVPPPVAEGIRAAAERYKNTTKPSSP